MLFASCAYYAGIKFRGVRRRGAILFSEGALTPDSPPCASAVQLIANYTIRFCVLAATQSLAVPRLGCIGCANEVGVIIVLEERTKANSASDEMRVVFSWPEAPRD